jgi:uncharacterized protein YbjT (DUF2867 family)
MLSPLRVQLPAGISPIGGDLADVDSLRAAMKGADTLFLLAPNVADELTQAILALSVARKSSIKGIVYLLVSRVTPTRMCRTSLANTPSSA